MSLARTIAAMAEAGCSAEQIARVALAHEAEAEAKRVAKRDGNAERQRRHREKARNANNACHSVTERDSALCGVTGTVPPEVSPKDNNQTPFLAPLPEAETRARDEISGEKPASTPEADAELLARYHALAAGSGRKDAHGSRLADDWRPNEAGRALAVSALGSNAAAHAELARFRDHWAAAPGQRGRKADWDATWRNWVRKAAEQAPRAGPNVVPMPRKQSLSEALRNMTDDLDNRIDDDVYAAEGAQLRGDPRRMLP